MDEDWMKKWQGYAEDFQKKQKEEERKNKLKEWGKLGGRPPKEKTKSVTISTRATEKQKEILKQKADKVELSLSEFLLRSGLNIPLPNAEKNKTLIEFRTNFKRIANHFRSNVWTPEEKKIYKTELDRIIKGIEKELQL